LIEMELAALRASPPEADGEGSEHALGSGDTITMADGTIYDANNGIIGLSPELGIYEGYDGRLDHDMPDKHRVEIAEYMIVQWTRVLKGEPHGR
jgi:hypothetical protein